MKITSTFRPLGDHLVVKFDSPREKTIGGLVLPKGSRAQPRRATVVSVGPGRMAPDGRRLPMPCCVGDVVLASLGGCPIELPEGKCTVLVAGDVLAVEKKK